MLNARAKLSKNLVGDVGGGLGDKHNAHALGTDQTNRLHNRLQELLGGVGEEQVGLVEEEDQLGLIRIAHFGQRLEKLSQEPHEEGREQCALAAQVGQLKGGNNATTVCGHAHKVGNIKGGFTEENIAARGLQSSQFTQNHASGRRGDPADSLEFFLAFVVIRQVVNDRAQVLQVNQRELLAIRPVEDQLQR